MMQKKILALALCALIPVVSIAVANAEDVEEEFDAQDEDVFANENRTLAKRMSCDDIKKEMDRLSAMDELDDEDSETLTKLKNDYRIKCSKRSVGRVKRTKTVMVAVTDDADDEDVKTTKSEAGAEPSPKPEHKDSCDNPDKNGCCPGESYKNLGGNKGFACCTDDGEHCYPPMGEVVEVIGCENGSKPDKNGCCSDENYKYLGDTKTFACCKADGVTCYPPIAK